MDSFVTIKFSEAILKIDNFEQISKEALIVQYEPFDPDNNINELLSWKFTAFEENTIELKLNFSDPLYVSQGDEPDTLRVYFV